MPRALRVLAAAVGLVCAVAASIAFGLSVAPAQTVSALGEQVQVGAAAPTFSLSGPGVLDLFGQALPTKVQFRGPVRPRLVLTRITVNQQVANFLDPAGRSRAENRLGVQLARGWTRYFVFEAVFVGLGALVLGVAYLGIRRPPLRRSLLTVLVVVVATEAVNLGGIVLTAYSAPRALAEVHSLSQLVGRSQPAPIAAAAGPTQHGIDAVVLGDSTAAALGNRLVAQPSALDVACHRSSDSYAADLAGVNGWRVENLACSGATVAAGILGPQAVGSLVAPSQLAVAKRAQGLQAVLVSVGADDVGWDVAIRLCAVSKTCDDAASTALFQSNLHHFTEDYYQLLGQLSALPGHPGVVINQYYDPFGQEASCLDKVGLTPPKQRVLVGRLGALNAVLANGAKASGFSTVQPDFSGHGLCRTQPYVQGLDDNAPFHPTAAGELAIALADEKALGTKG